MDTTLNRSAKQLQPYYNFIAQIRIIVESLIKDESLTRNGFKLWPDPNQYYCRTPDSIYLDASCAQNIYLWTPFGKVRCIYQYDCTNKLLEQLKTIATLEEVSSVVTIAELDSHGEDIINCNIDDISPIYKLTPLDGSIPEPCSYKLYEYNCLSCFDNINYSWDKFNEIFEQVSGGKNTF